MDVFCNQTIFYEKPPDSCIDQHMKLTQTSVISIILYSILFLLSSVCNLTMIVFLLREMRISKKRQNLNSYMIHLNIANLIITFITIPLEIGWKSTVYWRVGKFGCKFFQFLRPIGIYLSSFILIGLCIDRYAQSYPQITFSDDIISIKYQHLKQILRNRAPDKKKLSANKNFNFDFLVFQHTFFDTTGK